MTRCPTCGRRQKRSTQANALYWQLLTRMSEGLAPGGRTYTATQYHLYYRTRFLGADDVELPNGRTLTIPKSTAGLDVSEFSDYYTKVEADAAERGIYLEE